MQNLFIQKKVGACVLYCLANHLQEERILTENDHENVNGITNHEAGKLLEKYSDGKATLKTVFLDYTGLISPFVLEPEKLGIEKQYENNFICAFLTVRSKTVEDGFHWIYMIKKVNSDTVYISDPYLENVYIMSKYKLPELDIVEITLTVNPENGGILCYAERFFPYALA